eukprot:TRINITY_DN3830_c0_g1_i1.p1 TRINITY_DN3830_c0_g1~~TRINITY_DN3830_c0_g1_i1.p1  ORF type:complete len:183 (+),score=18.73 TRINITY_DN3830_c0_g1_i1:34-582(+)
MLSKALLLVTLFAASSLAFNSTCDYSSCGSCANDYDCVWCGSSQTCQQKTNSICSNDVITVSNNCPCADNTDCIDCLYSAYCGWCSSKNGGTCMNGTSTGPYTSTCTASDWTFTDSLQCPEVKTFFRFLGMGLGTLIAVAVSVGVCLFCVIPGICIYFCCCRHRKHGGYVEVHSHHGHHGHH